ADRMDESKYAVHKAHLEDKLQNLITSLAKYSDRNDKNNYQTQINAWVDSAIVTLPEYFQAEDRPLIVQQITESVDQAILDYDAEVAKHKTPQEVAKVNLAIAGKHRYEGKPKPLYRLREALKHPAIWSGVAIAAKALHFAPGVGGVLAGIRKHNWVADDLKRMEVERLHGHT